MKKRKTSNQWPAPVDALVSPRFSGVPTFMRLPHITRPEELDVALIGIPFDGGTTYRPGARFGPRHIRALYQVFAPVEKQSRPSRSPQRPLQDAAERFSVNG